MDAGNHDPILLPAEFYKNVYIKESLLIFGREAFTYSFKEKIQVGSLCAPSHLEPSQYDPEQIQKVSAYFKAYDNFNAASHKKIYISRIKAHRRRILNEDALEKLLLVYGFEKVFMEDLSFTDQRKLMAETSVLISNHGAGLTNMVFMPMGATIIELKADAKDINNCFFNLARSLEHKYFYTINECDNDFVQRANIFADINKLETLLKQLN